MAGHRFQALDGLRGVAAFCVVFRHVALGGPAHPLPLSYLAVDFFFCLSGFVLASSYTALAERRVRLRDHLLKRVIRLWPSYLLGLALTAGLLAAHDPSAVLRQLPAALLLLPAAPGADGALFPLMGPAWSLFAEFWIANLGFALLHRFWPPPPRAYLVIALAALPVFAAAAWIKGSTDFGTYVGGLPVVWARVLFSFSLGLWLRSWAERTPVSLPPVALTGLALLLVAIFALPAGAAQSLLAATMALSALVLIGSRVRAGGRISTAAEAAGALSYPLYVLHVGVGWAAVTWAPAIPLLRAPHATLLVAALLLPLSWAVAVLYEAPVRRWLERLLLTPLAPGASAAKVPAFAWSRSRP